MELAEYRGNCKVSGKHPKIIKYFLNYTYIYYYFLRKKKQKYIIFIYNVNEWQNWSPLCWNYLNLTGHRSPLCNGGAQYQKSYKIILGNSSFASLLVVWRLGKLRVIHYEVCSDYFPELAAYYLLDVQGPKRRGMILFHRMRRLICNKFILHFNYCPVVRRWLVKGQMAIISEIILVP